MIPVSYYSLTGNFAIAIELLFIRRLRIAIMTLHDSIVGYISGSRIIYPDIREHPMYNRDVHYFAFCHLIVKTRSIHDRRIIVRFQQLLAASQTGDAVGFRQLLPPFASMPRLTDFDALEFKMTANDPL